MGQQNHWEKINRLFQDEKSQIEKEKGQIEKERQTLKEQTQVLKGKNKEMRENQNKNTKLVLKINKQLEITRRHEEELKRELKDEQRKREEAVKTAGRGEKELEKEKEKYSRCVQNTVNKYEEEKKQRQQL